MSRKVSYNQRTYGSVFKLVKYLGYMTKVPTIVEVEGVRQEYDPPSRVIISEKFFRSFDCKYCGRCCIKPKFSLVYTESDFVRATSQPLYTELEWRARNKFVRGTKSIDVRIGISSIKSKGGQVKWSDRRCILYSNNGHQCDFILEKNGRRYCSIHKFHPNHCALPHIQIDRNKGGSARLLKRQYGRNWALGCEAVLGPFSYEKLTGWDLPCVKRLMFNAEDLGMETWLPEIVEYLERNLDGFKRRQPTSPVVIYDKKLGIPNRYLVKE